MPEQVTVVSDRLKVSKFIGTNWRTFSVEIERLLRAEELWAAVEWEPGLKEADNLEDKKTTTEFGLHLAEAIRALNKAQQRVYQNSRGYTGPGR